MNYSFWEFLGSRFTVPLLECLVRNLSLHQKLGELTSLSFALKRHHASLINGGIIAVRAKLSKLRALTSQFIGASLAQNDGKLRPWRQVAEELAAEHRPKCVFDLALELNHALQVQGMDLVIEEQQDRKGDGKPDTV